jgi:hypothetical protein
MVEVDVHTLELEVGGTIVPNKISDMPSTGGSIAINLLSITIETVLAGNGLPIIQLVTCQLIPNAGKKARHVPESGTNLVTL